MSCNNATSRCKMPDRQYIAQYRINSTSSLPNSKPFAYSNVGQGYKTNYSEHMVKNPTP